MDLNRVAIFVRVVSDGGFSAAARALGLPKSSVSRAVALLEEELGVRLLQRSTRKVNLTGAGSAFYEQAARGVSGLQEAAVAVSDMQSALRGLIRITAPMDAGVFMLEPLISRFVLDHPGVHIESVLTGRLVDMVEEGFDLAVRASRTLDPSLIARRLVPPTVALFASPAYLARRGTPQRVPDLASHDCVMFRAVRGRTEWMLEGPQGLETIEVSGPIAADEFSYLRSVLLSGVGIGLLPSFLCTGAMAEGKLTRVLPGHVSPTPPLNLVYPSARYLPHRVAVFRDYLVSALGREQTPAAASS